MSLVLEKRNKAELSSLVSERKGLVCRALQAKVWI